MPKSPVVQASSLRKLSHGHPAFLPERNDGPPFLPISCYAGWIPSNLSLFLYADARTVTKSVLLVEDSSDYSLHRVPVNSGTGAETSQSITQLKTIKGNAVEDDNGLYWIDNAGSVYRCTPANCANTKVVLATGQTDINTLFQDDSALYWARSSPNQIIRLAK